jgi:hypothetical protein
MSGLAFVAGRVSEDQRQVTPLGHFERVRFRRPGRRERTAKRGDIQVGQIQIEQQAIESIGADLRCSRFPIRSGLGLMIRLPQQGNQMIPLFRIPSQHQKAQRLHA